jgi:hypothetical protein
VVDDALWADGDGASEMISQGKAGQGKSSGMIVLVRSATRCSKAFTCTDTDCIPVPLARMALSLNGKSETSSSSSSVVSGVYLYKAFPQS